MKKRNMALIMSTLVFAATAILAGCSNGKDNSSDTSNFPENPSSGHSQEETQPDPQNPAETTQAETSDVEATESTSAETTESTTATEVPSEDESSAPVTDANGAVNFKITKNTSEDKLISAAQTLYESSCKTSWNYSVGCPYELNYENYIEDDLGWQYYQINDSRIKSMQDVEKDYNKIFSSEYTNNLSETYKEQDGKVYALDALRGSDPYYTGSKVVGVKERGDDEIVFSVENYYSEDDRTGEENITRTADFSVVISSDGNWRTGTFTLPY